MTNWYQHDRSEVSLRPGPRPGFPAVDESYGAMMFNYLKERELDPYTARRNGWYPTSELDEHPRIVIPCSNSANVPYFQARLMCGGEPRYKSPSATRLDSLATVWPFGSQFKGTVVVEGPMDALAAAAWGFIGIGLMGNDPPEAVYSNLANTALGRVIVIPDADHLEMGSVIVAWLGLLGKKNVKMIIPEAKDFATMPYKARGRLLAAA